jgi:hypothetical protein
MTSNEAWISAGLAAVCVLMWVILLSHTAHGGERLQCSAQPTDESGWHYRTKVPGYSGDVRDDRCWYIGPAMKPRNELYWPSSPQPMTITDPMRAPWELEHRWRGATPGWEHKE